ncbi:MMPL family transporter [Streptomyces sp. uw30]|uniref:MMPL family transporter n=1 Tax=Streptomyces sp. uw30 TaxID=1828179 RepID=UPI0011CD5248|nr:MMPL family transporter [Streptomyces sp. uw30]TXS48536.1 MMPL family transporter [Streptomyces sp. uw30]
MAVLLHRWGVFAVRRRRTVVTVWLFIVAVIAAVGVTFAGSFDSKSDIPGSAAQSALTKMDHHFGSSDHQSAEIVFEAPAGTSFKDPAKATALKESLTAAATVPGVTSVSDPMRSRTVSPDGKTALAQVEFSTAKDQDVPQAGLDALKDTGASSRAAGIDVLFGGDAYKASKPPVGPMEGIGVLVALAVLAITFGSLLSAGMPLLTALIAVVTSMAALMGLSSAVGISDKAPTLAIMLGLAVGIDYALFIVSRHRAELAQGRSVKEAAARAAATAGSAVAFAGLTVIIALAGLTVAGVPVLTSMGLSAAGAVAVAVAMSLGLLPALLAMAGERLRPRPGTRAARRAQHADDPAAKPSMGARWVGAVVRRPWRAVITVTLALAALALPASQLQLALSDDGSEPTSTAVRQVYDKIGDAFGPGANGPLVVLVTGAPEGTLKTTSQDVAKDLSGVSGIGRISPVDYSPDGAAARVQVIPTTGPRDPATSTLVTQLQDRVAPLAQDSGSDIAVTGQTAVSIEVSNKLSASLLPFALVVVGLSLLLLMAAFRSIAVPIKATVGFLLSVGASFGAIVAVFQWGWLAGALGVPSTGPVASFVPIIVMAVLFGLAMDYEVFMVSAMREEYVKTGRPHTSIIGGARHAARVVTAAALIMVAVFASFLFSHDPAIMPIALALAVGVLIDAFAVRMTLVPAVMSLLGHRAWWLPRRLDKWLPDMDVEGARLDTNEPAPAPMAYHHSPRQDVSS